MSVTTRRRDASRHDSPSGAPGREGEADASPHGPGQQAGRAPSGQSLEQLDALRRLETGVATVLTEAVDTLQVAASLESIGITDDLSRTRYGHRDVFALASDLFARAGAGGRPPGGGAASRDGQKPLPDPLGRTRVLHGLLYLLPAIALPAALGLLELRQAVTALVVGGATGWVWTAGSSWAGFDLSGAGRPRQAARLVVAGTAGGVLLSIVAGGLVMGLTHGPVLVAVLTASVMTYQLATMALFFLRRRQWIFWAMWPATAAGLYYLAVGEPPDLRRIVAAAGLLGVLALAGLSIVLGLRDARSQVPGAVSPAGTSGSGWRVLPVLLCAALSAAYLLTAQAAFLFNTLDAAVGLSGLIAAMGVVEWRAAGFQGRVRSLMARVEYPHQFHRAMPRLVLGEVALCAGVAGALSGLLAVGLEVGLGLTRSGVLVLATAAPLAAAYLLTFIHANSGRYAWLCGSLALSLAIQVGLGRTQQVTWPAAFLTTSIVLLLALWAGLVVRPRPARSYQ